MADPAFELGALGTPDPPGAALYTAEPAEYNEENDSRCPSISELATAELRGFVESKVEDRTYESVAILECELPEVPIFSRSFIEADSVTALASTDFSKLPHGSEASLIAKLFVD